MSPLIMAGLVRSLLSCLLVKNIIILLTNKINYTPTVKKHDMHNTKASNYSK